MNCKLVSQKKRFEITLTREELIDLINFEIARTAPTEEQIFVPSHAKLEAHTYGQVGFVWEEEKRENG